MLTGMLDSYIVSKVIKLISSEFKNVAKNYVLTRFCIDIRAVEMFVDFPP